MYTVTRKYKPKKHKPKKYEVTKEQALENIPKRLTLIKNLGGIILKQQVDSFDAYYHLRCKCNTETLFKAKQSRRRKIKSILFPKNFHNLAYKTFIVKYEDQLSFPVILTLNTFRNKYFYFAIDDILDLLRLNPIERENILAILYSPALLLHNNFSISFFNIWINGIYINKVTKSNKFSSHSLQTINYITIQFMYKIIQPLKKPEPIW